MTARLSHGRTDPTKDQLWAMEATSCETMNPIFRWRRRAACELSISMTTGGNGTGIEIVTESETGMAISRVKSAEHRHRPAKRL
jgi:hypothetical protein